MKFSTNSFRVYVMIIIYVLVIILASCTHKTIAGADSTISSYAGEEKGAEFVMIKTDLADISKYTSIIFPENSELLEAYTSKSESKEEAYNDLFDLLENGIYVKVSVEKEQIDDLFESIENNCTVIDANSSEKFFADGPFASDKVLNSNLRKYYNVVYSPDIEDLDEYTKEYMRIQTSLYAVEGDGFYNVYLGAFRTNIR